MKPFKTYLEAIDFEDMFGMKKEDLPKVVKKDEPQTREITLDLYRGFDADISNLKKSGDKYILSPHKAEQEALWFSQWLKDAKGRGKWLLKYPLKAIKHYQRIHYDDGSYSDRVPEDIIKQEDPINNSSIWGGVELPDGWLWSYKNQKYVIATRPILVDRDMIHKDSEYDEDF